MHKVPRRSTCTRFSWVRARTTRTATALTTADRTCARRQSRKTTATEAFKLATRLDSRVCCHTVTNSVLRLKVDGKKHHLGTFNTALEAGRAYNEAAKKYHGEFAALNDVGDHDLVLNQKQEA